MSSPTKEAVKGVQHLILYLKGAASYGILLPYAEEDKRSKMDELYGKFSDAHWRSHPGMLHRQWLGW